MRLASLLGPDLKQVLKEDPDQVRELLDEIHPEDLADIIGDLDADEAATLLARLPAEDAAPIFERLDEDEQGVATGSEFRTQPLWGIAAVGPYLHDGRANTLEEAILAHGGEAAAARDAFAAMSQDDRGSIVEFLLSLGGRDQYSTGLLPPGAPIPAVGEYGGPVRPLTPSEEDLFINGREIMDRDFSLAAGLGIIQSINIRQRRAEW